MNALEREEEGLHIIALSGEIDLACSPELRGVLARHSEAEHKGLIIDFSDVEYIDSSGLATLVGYVKSIEHYGGRLAIANVNDRVGTILELVRLGEVFGICPSLDAAKALIRNELSNGNGTETETGSGTE